MNCSVPRMILTVSLAGVVFAGQPCSASIVTLTNDGSKTHAAAFGTTKIGPLNDPFPYDPNNPGSALPQQSYDVSPPDLWHSPNGLRNATYAVLFDAQYTEIFVDFYARTDNPSIHHRDDFLRVNFYNGDWITQVHSEFPFNIDNTVLSSNRLIIPTTIEADRFLITTTATNWSIAELRANGKSSSIPTPSSAWLLVTGLAGWVAHPRVRHNRIA